ncbi:hypothetical protein DN824_03995 [Stutzerimonas nosocomialis]|uniref:LPS-assembly lipoprotein LptE n=1 Tax=Stutzerimonas nosocomialis TaxID=1056496 RepID=UPI001107ACCA|nr:LPS assembly lipoprotein LptE [Stutzerimonas nosocomialis]TLX60732.1 hypothetical protein DN824_03995 [Stutzerimonas nosocomialis]
MIIRNLLVLGFAALLSACGFQLRGTGANDFALDEIGVQARNAYGETVKELERVLKNNGVQVTNAAPYRLNLAREQSRQRTASYNTSGRSAEYELTNSLDYEFLDRNGLLLMEDRVEVQRVYVHDESNLISSAQEADQLRKEMRRELIQQLAMRLQRVTPAQLERLQQTAQAKARADAEAREAARRALESQPQQSPLQLPIQ